MSARTAAPAVARATLRWLPCSPRKVRLIADLVHGLPVDQALNLLRFDRRKAALHVRKVLNSAVANAEHNQGADIDNLSVQAVRVDAGATQKRLRARARGRSDRLLKRSSHVTVTLVENAS